MRIETELDEIHAKRLLEPPDYPHLFYLYIQYVTWNLVLL
jgi:hypothetical protein